MLKAIAFRVSLLTGLIILFAGAFVVPTADSTDLNQGLVGYWNFDECSGNIAHDQSGNGNNGTITGATWVTSGGSGCALSFDGNDDCVYCGDDLSLRTIGNMTVVAWIKIGQQGHQSAIAAKGTNASGAGNGWYLWVNEVNDRIAIQDNGPGITYDFEIGTTIIQPNTWYHVAGIFYADGYSRNKIYLNGAEEPISQGAGTALSIREDSNSPVVIGYYGYGGNAYFDGIIDEVGIYNRDLCAEEIQYLYNHSFIRGDANGDGVINSADVSYLINYLFINGPAPVPLETGDANCDGNVNSADVAYLINYLFVSGPPPGC